jgi:hypothetical protein
LVTLAGDARQFLDHLLICSLSAGFGHRRLCRLLPALATQLVTMGLLPAPVGANASIRSLGRESFAADHALGLMPVSRLRHGKQMPRSPAAVNCYVSVTGVFPSGSRSVVLSP